MNENNQQANSNENTLCTFVASVRMDLRNIATIAQFLASKEIFVGTRAKIASEAIRIIAHGVSDNFHVSKHIDAVRILDKLGYDASAVEGTRYYRTLMNEIKTEESQLSIEEEAMKLTKKFFNEDPSSGTSATIDKTTLRSILAPDKDKPETKTEPVPKTEPEPKPESEPESETPQLKTRTAKDEEKDISKLRTAMSNFSGAPIVE